MKRTDYDLFTNQLIKTATTDDQVLGLVALGSMADLRRRDDFSDHDFFLITRHGLQEHYRQDLSWLPNAATIVLKLRETAHGLKVMFESGHLIEFAVFDVDEISLAKANDYAVLVDKADVHERMGKISYQGLSEECDLESELLHTLGLFQVGAGRALRGEGLSGHIFIKSHAMGHLLPVLVAYAEGEQRERLDNLDVYRRFEFVFPNLGAKLNQALLEPPAQCALSLLGILDEILKERMPNYPLAAVNTLRDYLQQAIN